MSTTTKWILTITALAIAGCMCISVICIALGGVVLWTSTTESQSSIEIPINPEEILPTPEPVDPDMPEEPTRIPEATPTEQPESSLPNSTAEDTLRTLQENVVPVNDPVDLAERLKGVTNIPESVPATPRKVGDREKFWITNSDNDEKRQASAKLVYLNDVIYFWIEEGVDYDDGEVRALADTFANDIYPVNREFFGEEWNPGIDNDPRLHVLYVTGIGSTVAGYFSSADEVHPLAFEFSNAREMFVLSADNVTLGEEYVYSVMAHEFQHMIHFYTDRNEESWVNEGFSVLAELLNDYDIGGFDYLFISDPDRSLVFWPGPGES
ncbi:MAG: hypothetical protein HY835_09635, partial [Anaerolineae bacterium]|nr:hypothetical protein [Anaerolineae bacterium]